MSKTPKFLIARNPMAGEKYGHRVFILHAREPVMLAEVFHFELDEEEIWMACKSQFKVGSSVTYTYQDELICIGSLWMVENEKLRAMDAQARADYLAKLMSRMGDWYHAYLKWEDEQLAEEF